MDDSHRYLRIWDILGSKQRGIVPLIPISKSSFWKWVKTKKAPTPIKLGQRTTAWLASDIYQFIHKLNKQKGE